MIRWTVSQADHEAEPRVLLDPVVLKSVAVLHLVPCGDQTLPIRIRPKETFRVPLLCSLVSTIVVIKQGRQTDPTSLKNRGVLLIPSF
jgi:hypothetical protein